MPVLPLSTSTPRAVPSSEPTLRQGARGEAVAQLQQSLASAGFSAGAADGQFGPKTLAAVKAFQRARGLAADGVVGPKTWAALQVGSTPNGSATQGTTGPGDGFEGPSYVARGTAYYPANNAMEGGFVDRRGKPLYTLQQYLAGKAPYVSVAMDPKAFSYGTVLRIPELEQKYGQPIKFEVVDTGGAFMGKGTSRIDVCVADAHASLDAAINATLHLEVVSKP